MKKIICLFILNLSLFNVSAQLRNHSFGKEINKITYTSNNIKTIKKLIASENGNIAKKEINLFYEIEPNYDKKYSFKIGEFIFNFSLNSFKKHNSNNETYYQIVSTQITKNANTAIANLKIKKEGTNYNLSFTYCDSLYTKSIISPIKIDDNNSLEINKESIYLVRLLENEKKREYNLFGPVSSNNIDRDSNFSLKDFSAKSLLDEPLPEETKQVLDSDLLYNLLFNIQTSKLTHHNLSILSEVNCLKQEGRKIPNNLQASFDAIINMLDFWTIEEAKNKYSSLVKEKINLTSNGVIEELLKPSNPYEIRQPNIKNIFLAQYLKNTFNLYAPIAQDTLNVASNLMDRLSKYLIRNQFGNTVQNCGGDDCRDTTNYCILTSNTDILNLVDELFLNTITKNIDWINLWAWYTKGKLTLNPIGLVANKDSINNINKRIRLLSNKIETYTVLMPNLTELSADKYMDRLIDYKNEIFQLQNNLEILKKINTSLQKDELLYKLDSLIRPSGQNDITWYHNYDASKDFEFVNKPYEKKFKEPFSVFDKDHLAVAVHNIPENINVGITSTGKVKKVTSRLESEVFTPLSTNFASLDKILESFKSTSSAPKTVVNPGKDEKQDCGITFKINENCKCDNIEDLDILITRYNLSMARLRWLKHQTIPISELVLDSDETAKYQTKIFNPEKSLDDSLNDVHYKIFSDAKEDTLVAEKSFFKYKKVNFLPFVGLAYLPAERVNLDYKDGMFINTEEFKRPVDFYAGVKWYPWGINRSWDSKTSKYLRKKFNKKYCLINSIRGRGNLAAERLSFSLGLGINQDILNNYFLGFGWDPVPGLNLQMGSNLYFQRTFEFKNGLDINKGYKAKLLGPYYALTVDLGIANNLISIFKR